MKRLDGRATIHEPDRGLDPIPEDGLLMAESTKATTTAAVEPGSAPPLSNGSSGAWAAWLGLVVVAAAAGFVVVKMGLLPGSFGKAAPPAVPSKPVVLYMLALPLQTGQQLPGAVYIAEVR